MGRIISVEPYNPGWINEYQQEAARIQKVLSGELQAIHHIGSTAVPGLAAKPVIDILLEVTSLSKLDKFDRAMKAIDYVPRGEYGIAGRRYYIKGGDRRTHHLHAFVTGSEHILRHIAFRDYLRRHQSVAQQYAEVKREAVKASGHNAEVYSQLKNDFISRHEKLALAEQQKRQRHQSSDR